MCLSWLSMRVDPAAYQQRVSSTPTYGFVLRQRDVGAKKHSSKVEQTQACSNDKGRNYKQP